MQRRNTSQRQIVFESLAVLGHATTESLISYIKNNYDAISLATIYRNIGILLEEKKIRRVRLQNTDVLETIKTPHFHFVCQTCGRIEDVKADGMIRAVKEVVDQQAYDVESYDICFYGTCEECKKKEGEKQNEEVCM